MRLLIADDDPTILRSLQRDLSALADVVVVGNGSEALELLRSSHFDVFLTDVEMPGLRGDELLAQAIDQFPATIVVLMTGQGRVSAAVTALKSGAFDYIEKPFPSQEVLHRVIKSAGAHAQLKQRNLELEHALDKETSFEGMFGTSAVMQQVFSLIGSVAYSDATVLIEGDSGTGKELAARALHRRSPRHPHAFVAVNCAALSETLLESELFGYVKGAFTGADSMRRGLFEAANQGTIFLDEIGHVSPAAQVRLLRVLQEGEVRRVGSNESTKIDVRVVAATNVDLEAAVKRGEFRQDLFYRLNVINLKLPPLSARGDDLAIVAQHLLIKHARKVGKTLSRFSEAALGQLLAYRWPGNIRELENAVQHAAVLARGVQVEIGDLPLQLRQHVSVLPKTVSDGSAAPAVKALTDSPLSECKRSVLADFERRYLHEALVRSSGNITQAARLAGVDRSNFRRLLKEHGLEAQPEGTLGRRS